MFRLVSPHHVGRLSHMPEVLFQRKGWGWYLLSVKLSSCSHLQRGWDVVCKWRVNKEATKKTVPLSYAFSVYQDQLATLETKISRMEHQAAQHQQYVTLEVSSVHNTSQGCVFKFEKIRLFSLDLNCVFLSASTHVLFDLCYTAQRRTLRCAN